MMFFGKDERYKEMKCYNCLFLENNCLDNKNIDPCCTCHDRPNRKKDKSEFVEEIPKEYKEVDKRLDF